MWKMTWVQLMNRWRSNVWVCVELLLAFCLTWYMVDYFFVEIYNRSLPSGRGRYEQAGSGHEVYDRSFHGFPVGLQPFVRQRRTCGIYIGF